MSGGDPAAKGEEVYARRKQAVQKAPEQCRIVDEQDRADRPYFRPPVEDPVEGPGASDKGQHRQRDERPPGLLDRHDPRESRHDEVHRQVRQYPPMDGIVAGELRNFRTVDENPYAGEVVGVVDQRRDSNPEQRRERSDSADYIERDMKSLCNASVEGVRAQGPRCIAPRSIGYLPAGSEPNDLEGGRAACFSRSSDQSQSRSNGPR